MILRSVLRKLADHSDLFVRKSHYSQCGEDAVLQKIIEDRMSLGRRRYGFVNRPKLERGFYVEIGAFSPKRYSNSYWFYTRGWSGITVEPNPETRNMFRRLRRRDIHLNCAIGPKVGQLYYYSSGYACKNYSSEVAENAEGFTRYAVPCYPLSMIMEKHVPDGQEVHFLSVDCEGYDLEILKSGDWAAKRPWFVLVEVGHDSVVSLMDSAIMRFMSGIEYEMVSWTLATVIFEDKRSLRRLPAS
jgi:FkbM family methyltransferase